MADLLLLLLYVTILAIPFQAMGLVAYFLMKKRSVKRARTAGLLLPPVSFFLVFLAIFLWQQWKPSSSSLIPLLDGFMMLLLLVVMISGTILNFVFGSLIHYLIYLRGKRRSISQENASRA